MGLKKLAAAVMVFGLCAAPVLAGSDDKGGVWHASGQLKGMRVINAASDDAETLGHIEDLVIDVRSGEVVYYALGHGQTLGLGGKMFAIAPDHLQLTASGKYLILTGVTNKNLDNGQGFDANAWPTAPDKNWGKSQIPVTKAVNTAIQEGKNVVQGKPELARLTAITGSDVRTPDNKNLGSIYDVAIRFKNGKHMVEYAAVSHGGTAGVGGKLYAVPLNKFTMSSPKLNPNHRAFILNVNDDQFGQLEGFTSGQRWPDHANQQFWAKIEGPKTN